MLLFLLNECRYLECNYNVFIKPKTFLVNTVGGLNLWKHFNQTFLMNQTYFSFFKFKIIVFDKKTKIFYDIVSKCLYRILSFI